MPPTVNIEYFRKVFKEYYNPLVNFASNIIGNEKAEDAVQEVFVHIWEKKENLFIESPRSLLFKSVYHKCIEKIRKQKLETHHLKRFQSEKINDELLNETAEIFMLKEKINNSIRQLPPKCKEVFVLSKINGLTYREIAIKLNISEKTVENHMLTAFKKLRIILSDTL